VAYWITLGVGEWGRWGRGEVRAVERSGEVGGARTGRRGGEREGSGESCGRGEEMERREAGRASLAREGEGRVWRVEGERVGVVGWCTRVRCAVSGTPEELESVDLDFLAFFGFFGFVLAAAWCAGGRAFLPGDTGEGPESEEFRFRFLTFLAAASWVGTAKVASWGNPPCLEERSPPRNSLTSSMIHLEQNMRLVRRCQELHH